MQKPVRSDPRRVFAFMEDEMATTSDTNIFAKADLYAKMADDLRAQAAKRAYAEAHGLDPITLKDRAR